MVDGLSPHRSLLDHGILSPCPVSTLAKRNDSMKRQPLLLGAALGLAAAASVAMAENANDYPTMDRVDHVLTCMKENGGQTIDNLQRCSCQIDVIMQTVSFEEFNEARTYEIYKQMPGEKGGLFRDSERGKELVKKTGRCARRRPQALLCRRGTPDEAAGRDPREENSCAAAMS